MLPEIVISVSGAVRRPGVVSVAAGARAVHAVALCGGLSAEADTDAIELARPLRDGEHLIIARRPLRTEKPVGLSLEGEQKPSSTVPPVEEDFRIEPEEARDVPDQEGAEGVLDPSPRVRTPGSGPVDLNQATRSELESLPGVGPVMAGRILQARQASPGGSFNSLEELRAIRGIKGKTLERLRPHLKIEGP